MRIQLTHYCHHPQATGAPETVLDVPEAVARQLIERGGAVAVETAPPETPPAPEPVRAHPETATRDIRPPEKPRRPVQDRGAKGK